MRFSKYSVVCLLLCSLPASVTKADLIVNFSEVGSDVVGTYSGAFDTTPIFSGSLNIPSVQAYVQPSMVTLR